MRPGLVGGYAMCEVGVEVMEEVVVDVKAVADGTEGA